MTQLNITMPQPGETITEGLIVRWLIQPGTAVKEGDPLVELETEKALFEYESPFEGKLVSILHPENSRVPVGRPIAVIEVSAEKEKHYTLLGLAQKAAVVPPPHQPSSSQSTSESMTTSRSSSFSSSSPASPDFIRISPYVRRLAREKGVQAHELEKLASQNPDGRVTLAAIASASSSPVVAATGPVSKTPSPSSAYHAEPCSPIRMRIAENMVLSKSKIPHAHTGLAVDVSRVIKYRDSIKNDFKSRSGDNLSFLSLVYPAIIGAIRKHPVVNASYVDSTSPHEIRIFEKINLGVAVGTEHGLFIPVIHDIASLSRDAFNKVLNDLIRRAHARKLTVDELTGATLIFNNFGFYGTSIGVQVISYPLAATLGMGVIEKRVVPVGEAITIHDMADFVIAFDHRVMDGRDAGLFLSEIKSGIEEVF